MPSVNLIVLRSTDIESGRRFYEAIGLEFAEEQHGTGPVHFAAIMNGIVFEIYPGDASSEQNQVRLGFKVTDIENTLRSIRDVGSKVLTEPKPSPWGLRAVVEDPDGRKIELTERTDQ